MEAPGRPQLFSCSSRMRVPGGGFSPLVPPPPLLQASLTHTSTMMTMSLGDEAPWMYLPGRSLS